MFRLRDGRRGQSAGQRAWGQAKRYYGTRVTPRPTDCLRGRQRVPGIALRIDASDLDGNGIGDAVLAFSGYGLWSWNNNSSWQQLTALDPGPMALGNINGVIGDEVVTSFSGIGVWIFDSGARRQLHPFEVTNVVVANTDHPALTGRG